MLIEREVVRLLQATARGRSWPDVTSGGPPRLRSCCLRCWSDENDTSGLHYAVGKRQPSSEGARAVCAPKPTALMATCMWSSHYVDRLCYR